MKERNQTEERLQGGDIRGGVELGEQTGEQSQQEGR